MKHLLTALSFVLCVTLTSFAGGPLHFSPEHPMPGEVIKISYDVSMTPLADAEVFDAIAYLETNDKTIALEITLTLKENKYHGEITTTDSTIAVFVRFQTEDEEVIDANDKKGYWTMLFHDDRKTPVRKAQYTMAEANLWGDYMYKIEPDNDKAVAYMMQEFDMYPDMKEETSIMYFCSYLAKKVKDDAVTAEMLAIAGSMAKNKKSEKDMMAARDIYNNLEKEEMVTGLEEKIKKKYPKGKLVHGEMLDEAYAARKDPKVMAEVVQRIEQMIAGNADLEVPAFFYNQLVAGFAKEGDIETCADYLSKLEGGDMYGRALSGMATALAGEGLEGEPLDIEKAYQHSQEALRLLKEQINNPAEHKRSSQTDKQFVRAQRSSYASYAHAHALISHKMGHAEEALKYQEKAIKKARRVTTEMYERHVVYLEAKEGAGAAEAQLATYISENKANDSMKERYRALFLANNTVETAFDKHLAMLEADASAIFRKELKKKMIDDIAPDFTLVNLDGETMTLSEMTGKVVILDFWATWCGPCIKSFPAMQKTQEKYAADHNVQFLFINSWERGADKQDKVTEFIAENAYPFNVPMDMEDKTIDAYKVTGIPTKFIVGPDGHIRFKSVGFYGDNEAAVKELSMMIELAREAGTAVSMGKT